MTTESDHSITDAEFERIGWHDNLIYGIAFKTADPDANDWTSDLVLDIDHIVEWVCGADRSMRFRVAPATLTFHGITDFSITLDWGASGFGTALQVPSIDRIERERVTDQKVHLDKPYYRWRITLDSPRDGFLAFGAAGITQILHPEPTLQDKQWIAPAIRRALRARA